MSEKATNDSKGYLEENKMKIEYKFAIMLVERQIKTGEKIIKPDGTEKPIKVPRIDVLVLTDDLKDEFERINKMAGEIARKNGRSIVSYEDAEEAIKLVKIRKSVENGDFIK